MKAAERSHEVDGPAGRLSVASAQPFRGSLPTIRFATGATLLVLGLAGLTGSATAVTWLERGAAGWIAVDPLGAAAFVLFGGLMMLYWSNAAREASWMLMTGLGLAALIVPHLPGGVWTLAGVPDNARPAALHPLSAFLLTVTGIRIFSATRAYFVAPALDGVILGLSLTSLLGYLTGYGPLYASSVFSGISFIETLGFLALGGLFLLADVEYARLGLRVRRLPAAIGVSALAATVSLRITEAALDGFGHGGLHDILSGSVTAEAAALGATNLVLSLSIGAAAMFLLVARDNSTTAQRETALRKRALEDFGRSTELLNVACGELARIRAALSDSAGGAAAMLREAADALLALAAADPTPEALSAVRDEAEAVRRQAARLAALVPPAAPGWTEVAPTEVDFGALVRELIFANRKEIARHRTRILTHRAEGPVLADRGLLAQALSLLLARAVALTAGRTPLVSIRLDRNAHRCLISITCGGSVAQQIIASPDYAAAPRPDGAAAIAPAGLAVVEQIAAWHGGRFQVATLEDATAFTLVLPAVPSPGGRAMAGGLLTRIS